MHSVPILQACMLRVVLHGALLKSGNARVVHQNVQAAALFQDLRRHSLPVLFAPHIKAQITSTIT
ncbi:hypothetical protein D3C76_930060 [compost metagenome]